MIVTTTPRDVSWDVVATALQRGAWSCFAPESALDAVTTKARKATRRLRIRLQSTWTEGRVVVMPIIRGECALRRQREWKARREEQVVEDMDILSKTIRRQAAALELERR